MHDFWEPEENLHALALITQYYQGWGEYIRAATLRGQSMKFFKQHKKVPEKLLTILPPELAITVTTNPAIAQAVFNIWTEAFFKHLAPKLETITQYRKEQSKKSTTQGVGWPVFSLWEPKPQTIKLKANIEIEKNYHKKEPPTLKVLICTNQKNKLGDQAQSSETLW